MPRQCAYFIKRCVQAKQLVDQHTFEKECIGDDEGAAAKRLCFLAFIPGILDSKAAGRNAYIKACFLAQHCQS
jgi:hypothetical protein